MTRSRMLLAFEQAESEGDPAKREAWLTFVVVGGGPTGVELAGALAELARTGLAQEYRAIDPATARVILVQSAPRVLPAFSPILSAHAEQSLRDLGVDVRTDAKVTRIDHEGWRSMAGASLPGPRSGQRGWQRHQPPSGSGRPVINPAASWSMTTCRCAAAQGSSRSATRPPRTAGQVPGCRGWPLPLSSKGGTSRE